MKNKENTSETKQNYIATNTTAITTVVETVPAAPKYVYKGLKNETKFPEFVQLCKYTQEELKEILPLRLVHAGYTTVIKGNGYIYAKGDIPYLLTAHMDTVHRSPVKDFYEYTDANGNHIISSPQGIGGDDRCGIYMILEIIKEFKPSILFCEDEEVGGVGARKFIQTDLAKELEFNYAIELDRRGSNDAVFYDCDNEDFEEFKYLDLDFDWWYQRICYRNCAMVDRSDIVVFYVEPRENSGAYKVYTYAKQKKKI